MTTHPHQPQPHAGDIEFMSLVAHQLSTPLAAVRWYAQLLRKGELATPLDASQTPLVDEILAGAARLDELVQDLLDASHLDRDQFADEPTPTSVARIITEVQAALQPQISAHHLQLKASVDHSLPQLTARPSLLRLIVQHLFTNAVKYTPDHGTITLTVRPSTPAECAKLEPATSAGLTLSITDTGYGIPQADQPRLFTKFFRATNVRALGLPGTGLGLFIAATATAKLRGTINVESTEHHGSTFQVILPHKKP